MKDSELGMIPKDWEVGCLGDIITFIKGKKPNELCEKQDMQMVKYLTIDAINNGVTNYCSKDKMVIANKEDVLMVMDGASSGKIFYGIDGVVGSTLAKIVAKESTLEYICILLSIFQDEIRKHNTGSAIPHTDKNFIYLTAFVSPDEEYFRKFDEIISKFRKHIWQKQQENNQLAQMRDYLLPRLMSGEISL